MNIGGDIFDDILLRFPVKPLVRFKVVCKDWYFYIHSDSFIAMHMKNQKTNEKILTFPANDIDMREPDNKKFVVSICSVKEDGDDDDLDDGDGSRTLFHQDQQYYVKDISLAYLRNYEDNINNEDDKELMKIRPRWFEHCAHLVATCNGLVCLHWGWYTGMRNVIILWNPATRDLKALPSPQALNPRVINGDIGFGFDSTSNDYKVLRVVRSLKDQAVKQGMIYSLNTNSWREVDYSNEQVVIPSFQNVGYSISLPQNAYWVKLSIDLPQNQNQNQNVVLFAFDMVKEIFQSTPFPLSVRYDSKYESRSLAFFTLHESIALAYYGERLEIWTTNELEQGGESWIKVLNISQPSGIAGSLGSWKCKNSDDFIFLFSRYIDNDPCYYMMEYSMKGIYVNDQDEIKNGKMITVKFKNDVVRAVNVHTYIETLVSVNKS